MSLTPRVRIVPNMEPDQPGQSFLVTIIERVEVPADAQWPVPTIVDGNILDAWYTDSPGEDVWYAEQAQGGPMPQEVVSYEQAAADHAAAERRASHEFTLPYGAEDYAAMAAQEAADEVAAMGWQDYA